MLIKKKIDEVKLFEVLKTAEYIFWDLDGTFYDEKQYLFAAYKSFSDLFENSNEISTFLEDTFNLSGHQNLFDKCRNQFPNVNSSHLALFLEKLRIGNYKISLYDGINDVLLEAEKRGIKQFVVTNGNILQQKNKIRLLGLKDNFTFLNIYYANEWASKPAPDVAIEIKKKYQLNNNGVMIGDTLVDQEFAKNIDLHFIDIKRYFT